MSADASRKWTRGVRNSPLGALLVQNTVTAVLAANLVAALQGHARGALAAEVDDRGGVNGHGVEPAALVAEGVLGAHGGDLVGFTRHIWYVGGFAGLCEGRWAFVERTKIRRWRLTGDFLGCRRDSFSAAAGRSEVLNNVLQPR